MELHLNAIPEKVVAELVAFAKDSDEVIPWPYVSTSGRFYRRLSEQEWEKIDPYLKPFLSNKSLKLIIHHCIINVYDKYAIPWHKDGMIGKEMFLIGIYGKGKIHFTRKRIPLIESPFKVAHSDFGFNLSPGDVLHWDSSEDAKLSHGGKFSNRASAAVRYG